MTHWARDDDPAFFSVFELPWRPAEEELVAGLEQRLISRGAGTGGSTSLVRLPAGWRGRPVEATVELFVVEGSVSLGGASHGVGGYFWLPGGRGSAELASETGAHAYVFWTPSMDIAGQTEPRTRRASGTSRGRRVCSTGTCRSGGESLRLPDSGEGAHGGPGGLLRVMQWLPGFVAPKEHLHSTWEELVFLQGDWFAERGVVAPGSFLGNPGGWWHAPVTTRDGALALVHARAPLDLEQRECPGGEEFCRAYLERASWLELPATRTGGFRALRRRSARRAGQEDRDRVSVDARIRHELVDVDGLVDDVAALDAAGAEAADGGDPGEPAEPARVGGCGLHHEVVRAAEFARVRLRGRAHDRGVGRSGRRARPQTSTSGGATPSASRWASRSATTASGVIPGTSRTSTVARQELGTTFSFSPPAIVVATAIVGEPSSGCARGAARACGTRQGRRPSPAPRSRRARARSRVRRGRGCAARAPAPLVRDDDAALARLDDQRAVGGDLARLYERLRAAQTAPLLVRGRGDHDPAAQRPRGRCARGDDGGGERALQSVAPRP